LAEAKVAVESTEDAIILRKRVMDLAGPALAEMFLVSAVGMADMMMVGRIGPTAITAVGLTNQPMMFLQAAFMALNVGTTALVARLVGARDIEKAGAAAKQTLAVALVLGLVMSGLAVGFSRQILRLMGAEPDVMEQGVAYFRVVGAGLVFNAMAMNMTGSLRGAGDTKSAMIVNVTANICNLIGNYVLINGVIGFPKWGVFGAGLSTTLSRIIAFILFYRILVSGTRRIKPKFLEPYALDWPLLRRAFSVGIPTALEQFVLRFGNLVFTAVVSGLGTVTFAAHQVGMSIMSLSFMPGMAFSVASTTLVGQALGARRPHDAQRNAEETRKLGMIFACGMGVVFFFFGRQLAWLYSPEEEVIVQTAFILKISALVQPAQSSQFIIAGALRGAGDAKWALYASAIGTWVGRVALALLFVRVFNLGLMGAWIAMGCDQVARSLIINIRFQTGHWKEREV
jgi:putative MATE family efflux protein